MNNNNKKKNAKRPRIEVFAGRNGGVIYARRYPAGDWRAFKTLMEAVK